MTYPVSQHKFGALKRRRANEGIAMLVAMVIIMMVTATAMYSVTSTTTELRNTGYARQAMQTRNVAYASLITSIEYMDIIGPATIANLVENNRQAGYTLASSLGFTDPGMGGDTAVFRMYPDHVRELLPTSTSTVTYLLNVPYTSATSVGPGGAFGPRAVVDFHNTVVETRPVAGQSSDGRRKLRYLRTTITARARTQVANDYMITDDSVPLNQGARDLRAYVRSGPFLD